MRKNQWNTDLSPGQVSGSADVRGWGQTPEPSGVVDKAGIEEASSCTDGEGGPKDSAENIAAAEVARLQAELDRVHVHYQRLLEATGPGYGADMGPLETVFSRPMSTSAPQQLLSSAAPPAWPSSPPRPSTAGPAGPQKPAGGAEGLGSSGQPQTPAAPQASKRPTAGELPAPAPATPAAAPAPAARPVRARASEKSAPAPKRPPALKVARQPAHTRRPQVAAAGAPPGAGGTEQALQPPRAAAHPSACAGPSPSAAAPPPAAAKKRASIRWERPRDPLKAKAAEVATLHEAVKSLQAQLQQQEEERASARRELECVKAELAAREGAEQRIYNELHAKALSKVAERVATEQRQRMRLERLLGAATADAARAGLAAAHQVRAAREAGGAEAAELALELAHLYGYAVQLEAIIEAARAGAPLPPGKPGLRRVKAPALLEAPAFPADRRRLEALAAATGAAERVAWQQQDSARCAQLEAELATLRMLLAPFEAAGTVEAARAAIEATALAEVEAAVRVQLEAELQPERLERLAADNAHLARELRAAQDRERNLAIAVASYRRVEEKRVRLGGVTTSTMRPIGLASVLTG